MKTVLLMAVLLFSPLSFAQSLYQQLGEQQGIETIVEEMLYRVGGDERIAHHFDGVDIMRVHKLISEQVCDLSGGPCDYSGEDMKTSHRNMGVDNADFNALVEHLIAAMEKEDVPVSAQNQLLGVLAPMHGDIVEE
ncbi:MULTISPECIES: group I truncated hemoglobin [Idiomarina]|jgi:hemoglobin|uniref:Group 1 truncated hemoglobin n=1 Tax=Idiomarina loihiensis (strain ATCC BAA-735 / DSM 15497 / L2-TR) TaxID=283942 RepID=Q5QV13_IDILO|nr:MULTISPECIES: group 1 truncated hemoglobin [Idiomarina]AAV81773.1 Cyanoglobin family protein [Idiomarina loihiensis L2TR]AGM35803.1 cyanoglobin family protein [Idiomarina loihiensis GSL 199]PHQ89329.1 MAG: group 1 truncated hemoglobin [Idiomarina sp.]|tara:strand:+ start:2370 stop:2777 length:408 start_codon:yes stop_codon:yes gene_type:complete